MTRFLLKLSDKNSGNFSDPSVRSHLGRLGGIVGILFNFLLFAGKLAAGVLSSSVSIIADAVNSLNDATSSVVSLIGFKLAELPPDRTHPYGHARFEYLSGLAVAAMILIIGVELVKSSFSKILTPEEVLLSPAAAAILICSIAAKLWLWLFQKKLGSLIQSSALLAASTDSRNDIVSTSVVLLSSVIGTFTGWRYADGVMGLIVAVFIICSGVDLAKKTISPLLGENADPRLQHQIVNLVCQAPKVLGYHDLMVHDYGPGQRFASIHVEMDHREDSLSCHDIINNIERQCLEELKIHLVIHFDPVVVGDPELERLRAIVVDTLKKMDSRLTIHDFRMVPGENHVNLIFDMPVPDDLKQKEPAIEERLNQVLAAEEKTYHTVITYDSAAFNIAGIRCRDGFLKNE